MALFLPFPGGKTDGRPGSVIVTALLIVLAVQADGAWPCLALAYSALVEFSVEKQFAAFFPDRLGGDDGQP